MKKFVLAFVIFSLCLVPLWANVFAQEEASESGTDWKQEVSADIQQLKEQRQGIKQNAEAARQEEKNLRDQMHQAVQSGDMETAKSLREQLKAAHQENLQQKQQDIQALKEAKQGIKQDVRQARQEAGLPPRGDQQQGNPPGYNPPGAGPGNPPGYNPPGAGLRARDRMEDKRDRREDVRDHKEDIRDRREDVRDRKEDVRDKREDVWDAKHNPPPGTEAYRRDKQEDIRDRKEDVRDRNEDVRDRREDVRDRKEDKRDRREDVRDKGSRQGHGNIEKNKAQGNAASGTKKVNAVSPKGGGGKRR